MTGLPSPSRRGFLAGSLGAGIVVAAGAAALAAHGDTQRPVGQNSMVGVPFGKLDTVRVGTIGLGARGHSMTLGWASQPGVELVAVCDIREDRANRTADAVGSQEGTRPAVYGGSADSYKQMYADMDLDLVYVATPWEFHYEQGRDALLAGAHAMVELPIATELSELWSLVDISEQTGKHLMLAENCSYGRNELAMLKMSHEGVFGDVTNGHGGYLHDLRSLLFSEYYTDDWRRMWHTRSTASFYPMHGLAPVAAAMDINRGDRFLTLSATATPPKGLADYRARHMPAGHRSWGETYVNGDLITCMISTDKGRIIRAEHDVSTPRPYSRINSIAGSRGIFEDYAGGDGTGARVYFEPDHTDHGWRGFGSYRDEFDHWLWTDVGGQGGHGGMDGLMQWRTIQLIRTGGLPDIDVYDSAAWCAPVPLSVASLEQGGAAVDVPDFTRGEWKRPRLGLNSVPGTMPGA